MLHKSVNNYLPFQKDNRDIILQAIMFHEIIGKRTSALNQLRDGLKVLGVLDVIESNPILCAPLFIYQHDSITVANVKSVLKI